MLYDFSKMNIEQTKQYLSDTYDKHKDKSKDMLMRVRITRRVLSILSLHPSWDEDDVFQKVQDSFRKGKGSVIVRTIDREIYDYFKQHWLNIIKLEPIEEGEEFKHYAKWSNVKLTKEEYMAKARAKWGDAYDYSESVYISGLSPITIRCIKHDYYFTVQAGNHIAMAGKCKKVSGCPLCSQERVAEQRAIAHRKSVERKLAKKNSILNQVRKCRANVTPQEIFIRKAKALYPDYDYSKVEYSSREKRVTIGCPKHGFFSIAPRLLLAGVGGSPAHGCWKCCGKQEPVIVGNAERFSKFKEDMANLYGDKYSFHWEDYVNSNSMIRFFCEKHGEQSRRVFSLKDGKGCLYCNGKFYPGDAFKKAKEVHGDKYEYDESMPPQKTDSRIRYRCPVHGWQSSRYDSHVLQGHGCPLCGNYTNNLSREERKEIWLKRCKEKFNDRFDYSQFKYVDNDTRGIIICRERHYAFTTSPDTHVRGAGGCPYCVGSTGEVHIRTWLENNHITFEPQYKIPNENLFCKRQYLCVDFYLPQYNMFVEMNGEQHYEYISYFHSKDESGWTFEDQQIRDDTLRAYCKERHIALLEIRYDEIKDIPKILRKNINPKKKVG